MQAFVAGLIRAFDIIMYIVSLSLRIQLVVLSKLT